MVRGRVAAPPRGAARGAAATRRSVTAQVAWGNRSACQLRLDRGEDAFDDAERCLWLAPAYAKGYLRMGGAEWRLGRRADARASYEAGLAVEPENERLKEELARLRTRPDTAPRVAAQQAMSFAARIISPTNRGDAAALGRG